MAAPAQQLDPTFRTYNATQADDYHQARRPYPRELYDYIFSQHEASGGKFNKLVDLGCGPGLATRELASSFDHVIGADPGAAMIDTAKQQGGTTKTGEPIQYEVCAAEECSKLCGEGEVDMLTGATTAHWWEMENFWPEAARLIKPGGTVAIFGMCHYNIHPENPNYEKIKQLTEEWRETYLDPFRNRGNELSSLYLEPLGKPWESTPEAAAAFPKEHFAYKTWNKDGSLDGPDGKDFFGGSAVVSEKQMLALLSTSSAVTRWREANPELANTDQDVVNSLFRKFKELTLSDGSEGLRIQTGFALLLFKRV